MRGLQQRLNCKRSASIRLPRFCTAGPAESNGRPRIWNTACIFCGTVRNAATPLTRLTTRRSQVQILPRYCEGVGNGAFRMIVPGMAGIQAAGFAAPLTTWVPCVNLGVIFATVYPVATLSRTAWSAARNRPADVVRNR